MLSLVSAHIVHLILEIDFNSCILINDCILQDFKGVVDLRKIKSGPGRCCVGTFLRRPSTERETSIMVHREFVVARNLKLATSNLL
jgi:hypothetical protein